MFTPDFRYVLDTLTGKPTNRPVMVELGGVHSKLIRQFCGDKYREGVTPDDFAVNWMHSHKAAGFDCLKTSPRNSFYLPRPHFNRKQTISWNENVIEDWEELEAYPWPWPREQPMDMLDAFERHRVDGMGVLVSGSCGLIENAIVLAGYDNLCLKTYDDPTFVAELFKRIGERVYEFYDLALQHPATDAIIMNDDWGFKNQTFFSPSSCGPTPSPGTEKSPPGRMN